MSPNCPSNRQSGNFRRFPWDPYAPVRASRPECLRFASWHGLSANFSWGIKKPWPRWRRYLQYRCGGCLKPRDQSVPCPCHTRCVALNPFRFLLRQDDSIRSEKEPVEANHGERFLSRVLGAGDFAHWHRFCETGRLARPAGYPLVGEEVCDFGLSGPSLHDSNSYRINASWVDGLMNRACFRFNAA